MNGKKFKEISEQLLAANLNLSKVAQVCHKMRFKHLGMGIKQNYLKD